MKNLCAAAVLSAPLLLCQTQTQNPDATIQTLLSEVRQLRLAVERATAAAPRIQITMQRLQWQEQKVERLTQQLSTLRDNAASLSSVHARMAEEVRQLEMRITQEQEPAQKKQLETERRAGAAVLEQHRQQAQQAQLKESELSSALRTEQARLDELAQRLSTLEQSLQAQ